MIVDIFIVNILIIRHFDCRHYDGVDIMTFADIRTLSIQIFDVLIVIFTWKPESGYQSTTLTNCCLQIQLLVKKIVQLTKCVFLSIPGKATLKTVFLNWLGMPFHHSSFAIIHL